MSWWLDFLGVTIFRTADLRFNWIGVSIFRQASNDWLIVCSLNSHLILNPGFKNKI